MPEVDQIKYKAVVGLPSHCFVAWCRASAGCGWKALVPEQRKQTTKQDLAGQIALRDEELNKTAYFVHIHTQMQCFGMMGVIHAIGR